MESTTYQILNKTGLPGTTLADTLLWLASQIGGGGGVTDHGALTGLGDDDHLQYLNNARGDLRYAALAHGHSLASGAAAGFMSAADFTKLGGIAAGATANSSDAFLRARANHTGVQLPSTIDSTGASTGQVLTFNGTNYAPAFVAPANAIIPAGLVEDGVTNNSFQINAALATGRPVYLPSITGLGYKLNTRLAINHGNQLFGDERKTKLIMAAGDWAIEIRSGNCVVQNLLIDCTAGAGSGVFLMRTDVAVISRAFIRNIESFGATAFIYDISGSNSIIYFSVHNCIASLHRGPGVILTKAFAYLKMSHVTIDYVGSASRNHGAFRFENNQGAQLSYLDTTNGIVDGVANADGFTFVNCIAVWMNNCMADTVPGRGFYFASGNSYFYISNCVSSLCGGHGYSIPPGSTVNEFLSFTGCVASGRADLGGTPANADGFNYGATRCIFSNLMSMKNSGHGFQTIAGTGSCSVSGSLFRANVGRGVKTVSGSFIGTGLTMSLNTVGNYGLAGNTQYIQASMNSSGGLVNVTGPVTG